MANRIELMLRPKTDVKPLDLETAERIGRVARAEIVELDEGGAVFGFSLPAGGVATVHRSSWPPAASWAHWHTRYELVSR